jgi:hypothetical protein
MDNGPRRRSADNHVHPEYWTAEAHHRFEDRVSREIHNLREDVEAIGTRLTLLIGGLAILAFAVPILVPIVQSALNIPRP